MVKMPRGCRRGVPAIRVVTKRYRILLGLDRSPRKVESHANFVRNDVIMTHPRIIQPPRLHRLIFRALRVVKVLHPKPQGGIP